MTKEKEQLLRIGLWWMVACGISGFVDFSYLLIYALRDGSSIRECWPFAILALIPLVFVIVVYLWIRHLTKSIRAKSRR